MQGGGKRNINVLANIDNYLGEHDGKMAPVLIFLCISATPFLIYALMFQRVIPLKYVIIFEILWTVRWAVYIFGDEKKKKQQYRKERENVYKTADQVIRVSHIADDGLIEYSDGSITYILVGYLLDYIDDDSMTIDVENFLKQLRGYSYDIYSQMVIDEYRLQDDISSLQVYEDTNAVGDRMLFYQEQDEYCSKNSECFRVCIAVKGAKYSWKDLHQVLEHLVNSEVAYCWKEIHIATPEDDTDIFSRDLCLDVNVTEMLVEKYKTDEYYGSKVMFYGTKVPDEYKKKRTISNLEERRVSER